jgi:hypothetical protein
MHVLTTSPLQLDWLIALPACIMFFALQLDRGNITQALSDNMLGKSMGRTSRVANRKSKLTTT